MLLQVKSKKGVSIMIGYVLLVVFAIIISFVVYRNLITYVPKDALECPEGVSIFIKDFELNSETMEINLTLRNNGKFSIAGYFIYARDVPDEKVLATIDLSNYTLDGVEGGGYVLIGYESKGLFKENSFEPNQEINNFFNMSEAEEIEEIYSVEIIPIRFQEEENKIRFVTCGDARAKKVVS